MWAPGLLAGLSAAVGLLRLARNRPAGADGGPEGPTHNGPESTRNGPRSARRLHLIGFRPIAVRLGALGAPNAALRGPCDPPGPPFGPICGPFTGRKSGFWAKFRSNSGVGGSKNDASFFFVPVPTSLFSSKTEPFFPTVGLPLRGFGRFSAPGIRSESGSGVKI